MSGVPEALRQEGEAMSEMADQSAAAEAAELRAVADMFERRADAIAITYQDAERRREATAWERRRVRELRAAANLLDPREARKP